MIVLDLLVLSLAVCGIGYVIWQDMEMQRSASEIEAAPLPDVEALLNVAPKGPGDAAEAAIENPIDFAQLKEENPDIYAWIYLPNTNINLPVLRSANDDSFYLNHNRHGDYAVEGSVYSESLNAMDFSDPVTVLYGHNIKDGTMFSDLHKFEDRAFFDDNRMVYVFTPDRLFAYEIVAASRYDNQHILKSHDFSDAAAVQQYFDFVCTPRDDSLVRGNASLSAQRDKIIQLSTCTGDAERLNSRYVVTAKLLYEQKAY